MIRTTNGRSNRARPLLAALVAGLALGATAPAGAAGAAACQVVFNATFAPGLAGAGNTVQAPASHALTISGTMTCPGSTPSTASVSVGSATFTTPATDPGDIAAGITTYTWKDPAGTVLGGCLNNSSSALSISRFSDGGVSITQYTTNSMTYGIGLSGTGVASAAAVAVNPAPGQPATYPVTATRDVGARVAGALIAAIDSAAGPQAAFTACNSTAGLTTVTLTGVETIASAP